MYLLQQRSENLYFFITDFNVKYSIEFILLSEVFSFDSYLPIEAYFLNINAESKVVNTPLDFKIAETVAKAVYGFLQDTSKCCVFNCDTADGRQEARYRKFDYWYKKFNDGTFLKYNKAIYSPKSKRQFYTSLMIRHSSNSYKAVEWYENWLDNYSK